MKTLNFPELRQIYNYDCGACAVCCILAYYGLDVREEGVMKFAGTTEKGTSVGGIIKTFEYYGFPIKHGTTTIKQLREAIDNKFPTIITIQAYRASYEPYSKCWDDGHYVVAIGYSDTRIYFEDPASYCRTWLSDLELEERWHDSDDTGQALNWGCTVIGKPAYKRNTSIHMD